MTSQVFDGRNPRGSRSFLGFSSVKNFKEV